MSDEEFRKRFVRSFLDIIIASIIKSKGRATGYEIVMILFQEYSVLFSPGTVYPVLFKMMRRGLVTREECDCKRRVKPFILTESGVIWHEEMINQLLQFEKFIEKDLPLSKTPSLDIR